MNVSCVSETLVHIYIYTIAEINIIMKYHYYTCDVFTTERFGGNPLAVFPAADGLTDWQMLLIAKEFNYSETTFCLKNRTVRIFTPTTEVPFAGHPNIGTAFCLATIGDLGEIPREGLSIILQQKAGVVPITIHRDNNGLLTCELQAPHGLSTGSEVSIEQMAEVLCLSPSDIDDTVHLPTVASVGLQFLIVRVNDQETLGRTKINLSALEGLAKQGVTPDVHVYCCCGGEEHEIGTNTKDERRTERTQQLCARMFAPMDNVPEDPATGSANAALAALLTNLDSSSSPTDLNSDRYFSWTMRQGIEMGRPSLLHARTHKDASTGKVQGTWIRGSCVMVSEGWMEV